MKNWWEEDEEFDFSGRAQDSFEAEKSSDDKSFEEVFGTSFDEMPLRQQIETAYDYYDKPQNREDNLIKILNNYFVPKEAYTSSDWGNRTAEQLDEYMKKEYTYPGKTKTGILAPFYDFKRNYDAMKKSNLKGGDNFFHCKANYEAAKRGPWGRLVGKTLSLGREAWGMAKKEPLADARKDWYANQKGWQSAKEGMSLQEACPRNPKVYVDPDDYDDLF